MSIKDDFQPYKTATGYYCPSPIPPGTVRGSDNQVMYLSEFMIMLHRNGQADISDTPLYKLLIELCIGSDSELHRAPGDNTPDEVDDYYGAYAAHVELGLIPAFRLPLRLWRQPQLVAAMVSASFGSMINPVHYLLRLIALPFYAWAALVIATSCINTPTDNADARRLSWHLVQATKRKSLMCKLASLIWYARLKKDYGEEGFKEVAGIYYNPKGLNNSAYSKWWIS